MQDVTLILWEVGMWRKLAWIAGVVLLALTLGACPRVDEEEGTGIESPGRRPSYDKVKLALKLTPGLRYRMVVNSVADAQLKVEAAPAEKEGAAETQVTSQVTSTALQKQVATGRLDESGRLHRTEKVLSFMMDETVTDNQEVSHRSLMMDEAGAKLVVDDQPAELKPGDKELLEALKQEFTSLVDARAQVEFTGDSWQRLLQARSSPLFPQVDWDRITLLALVLPEEKEVSVGTSWERDATLELGDGTLRLHFISTLKEVVGEGAARLAQIGIQVSGQCSAGCRLHSRDGMWTYDTKVEKLNFTGSYHALLDLAQGNYRNVNGDLTLDLVAAVTLTSGGESQVVRASIEDAHITMNQDAMLEEVLGGAPAPEPPAEEPSGEEAPPADVSARRTPPTETAGEGGG